MSAHHPDDSELQAFLHGALPGREMFRVAAHASSCERCGSTASRLAGPAVANLTEQIAAPVHRIAGREAAGLLTDFAGGERSPAVDEHLRVCEPCAATVEAMTQPPPVRPRAFSWMACAVAALLAVVVGSLLFRRESAPVPVPPRDVRTVPHPRATPPQPAPVMTRGEWQAVVEQVVRDGRLVPPPVLADVWLAPETQRSPDAGEASAMFPAGEVIESARPFFRWPQAWRTSSPPCPDRQDCLSSTRRYVVHLYEDDRELMRSPELRVPEWRPPHELRRGRTYSWEVAVHADDAMRSLPAPPDPPARFHVLSAERARELERAKGAAPRDHLLLGILYARAGLRRDALAELETASAGGDAAARRLLESVRAWRPRS